MKKYISLYMLALLAIVGLTSCDKDTEGLTWTTYYPQLTIEGEVYSEWQMGTPYVDPGYQATSAGEDITSQVKVSTSMDLNSPAPGYYAINYAVTNEDGNSSTATRYVLVADPNDPVSGYYYNDPNSYRDYNGATVYYGASYMSTVIGNGDGTYAVSDLFGGWYSQRANYGSSYNMQGEVAIADDGTITLLESYIAGWGDSLVGMSDGIFDAATSTITWDVEYVSGMAFHVIMTKKS